MLSVFQNSNERIPNRKDSDYFDSYENLNWRPAPWYNRIFNFIYRFLYFITGPRFVVPILGNVLKSQARTVLVTGLIGFWTFLRKSRILFRTTFDVRTRADNQYQGP